MHQREIIVATEVIVFDFELFIGGLREKRGVISEGTAA